MDLMDGHSKSVLVNGSLSRWRPVRSGFLRVLSWDQLVLFNIFTNDINSDTECSPSRFADDTKLSSAADTTKGKDAIHRDLDKLKRICENHMKFNKAKHKVLHLGQFLTQVQTGEELIESSPTEKDFGGSWE